MKKASLALRLGLPAGAIAALLGGALLFWPSRPHAPARATASPASTVHAAAPETTGRRAVRARYRLSSEHHVFAEGREQASVVIEGFWVTTQRSGGLVEARFAATRIAAKESEAPAPSDVAAPFALFATDGVLDGIGFAEGTTPTARALLTGLATTLQHTDREEPSWTVEEEDLTGRYVAEYHRLDAGRVTRTRARYTALRGAGGLEARGSALVPDESTELLFDEKGLASASVRLETHMPILKGKPPLRITQTVKLVREAVEELPWGIGPIVTRAPISDHVDHAALAHRRDEALVAGASAPELVAEARRAAHVDPKAPGAGKEKAQAVRRLSALVNLDGEAAGTIATTIRRAPSDSATVGLLEGALASTRSTSGADALASLFADESLPAATRTSALTNLALASAPSAGSAAALSQALDGPFGADAATALGSQARGLGDDGAGGDAVDQLLQRYAGATSEADKITYLTALGNTGSRKALDVMEAAITGPDYALAGVGTFGLRLIPGDDVDDALLGLIQTGNYVILQAIQATAFRSSAVWEGRLEQAETQFAGQKTVLDAIAAVLVRWTNLARPAQR